MLSGLYGATIWSEDLNNLVPFYRDVLGLKVAIESPSFVVFGEIVDGTYAGAYLGVGTHGEVKGKPSDPFRHMVGLHSTDVDADFQRVVTAGAEAVEAPTRLWRAADRDAEGPRGKHRPVAPAGGAADSGLTWYTSN